MENSAPLTTPSQAFPSRFLGELMHFKAGPKRIRLKTLVQKAFLEHPPKSDLQSGTFPLLLGLMHFKAVSKRIQLEALVQKVFLGHLPRSKIQLGTLSFNKKEIGFPNAFIWAFFGKGLELPKPKDGKSMIFFGRGLKSDLVAGFRLGAEKFIFD